MYQHAALHIDEIKNHINALKKSGSANIITNYYWQNKNEQEKYDCIIGNGSIFFTEKDAGFARLFFYSIDQQEFNNILPGIDTRPLIIDYLSNVPVDEIDRHFTNAGFELYAKMLRFRSGNIPQVKPPADLQATPQKNRILERLEKFFISTPVKDIIHFALESDIDNVLSLLYAKLDKYTGHFPSREELNDLITRKQVLVIKDGENVTGLVLFKLSGKTCNLDQGYSDPANEELINVKLFFEFYKLLNQKEVKSMYLWVEEKNKTVINLHKSFGLKPDGLIDYIYIKN